MGMRHGGMGMGHGGHRMGMGHNNDSENGMGGGMGMMSMAHPIHMHGQYFQIISRSVANKERSDYATVKDGFIDEGWKDTVLVMPGERRITSYNVCYTKLLRTFQFIAFVSEFLMRA